MADTLRPYLTCVRHTLDAALCLQRSPCQQVERYNKPEVEFQYVACTASQASEINTPKATRHTTTHTAQRNNSSALYISPH